ncbi:MAG: tol-pal system protein YbgF [Myxococcota bacterium]
MRLGVSPLVAAWAGALVLSGCTAIPRFQALERDVAELRRESLPDADQARIHERLADLGEEVASLRSEVAALRGQIEEVRHATSERPRTLARPPEVPEPGNGRSPGSPVGSSDIAQAGVRPAEPIGSGELPQAGTSPGLSREVRDYENAFRLYRAGDYRRAIDRFEAFLQTHPSSDYADNALFWMGECYFKLGDHERAVLVFEDVVKRYPDGNKVPDALYRQGRALLEIGARSQQAATYAPAARQVFERIVLEHPDSERVLEAKRELERLGP